MALPSLINNAALYRKSLTAGHNIFSFLLLILSTLFDAQQSFQNQKMESKTRKYHSKRIRANFEAGEN